MEKSQDKPSSVIGTQFTLTGKATNLTITYTAITNIYPIAGGLLTQKFKAEREDGAVWCCMACSSYGVLKQLGELIPEIREAHEKRQKWLEERDITAVKQ